MTTDQILEKLKASKNEVGDVLDIKKAACREWPIQEYYSKMIMKSASSNSNGMPCRWSWGLHAALIMVKDKALRFKVSGLLHKGYVYLIVNGADLFDVYYTNSQSVIKKISKDVYLEDLMEVLHGEIER
jgi:hypothetical protein